MGTAAVTLTGSGNWTAPPGVTQITVFAVGAGGGAASGNFSLIGQGGGGGEAVSQVFTVIPGNNYAYVVGAGGAGGGTGGGLSGSAGGNSTFTVGATVLTAHGGAAGAASGFSRTGGLGGSGSSAPTEFPGGNGGGSYPYTGGGGSSGGTASSGNNGNGYGSPGAAPAGGGAGGSGSGAGAGAGQAGSLPGGGGGGSYETGYAGGAGAAGTILITYPGGAPTNNGAAAVAGGGAGGAGGPSNNTAGSAGAAPGGGGGGADSTGTTEAGGAGASGQLIVTPYQSAAFKTLIVHSPNRYSPMMFMPMVSVGAGSGTPNGGTQYTMPQPVTNVNADFGGTYTIVLTNASWNSPSSPRTIFVTVTQYEYSGGASYPVSTTPVTVTPSAANLYGPGNQVNNGILIAGVLTLPFKAVAPDNVGGYYSVSVTDSNTSDRFYDCLFLDTMGQTFIINEPTTGYVNYYIDQAPPTTDLGYIMGSQFGRPDAISVADACQSIGGGVISLEPNDNLLFVYAMEGAPNVGVSYFPNWFYDRIA